MTLAEGCWGAILLIAPDPLLGALADDPVNEHVIFAVRVLGARQLLQAIVTSRRPTCRRLQIGAAVDAAHAVTMTGLAVADIGPRRLTLASATTAAGFAALGAAVSCRG